MRKQDRPWPIKVENRIPGMKYALFPPLWMECSCGKPVKNIDSVLVAQREPMWPPVYRFQHGDNREAVYVMDAFTEMSLEEEARMAEWTEKIHEYEKKENKRMYTVCSSCHEQLGNQIYLHPIKGGGDASRIGLAAYCEACSDKVLEKQGPEAKCIVCDRKMDDVSLLANERDDVRFYCHIDCSMMSDEEKARAKA
jgi:hypothetical protein